jgi:crossover junction endodeoxyribonuclease RusA
MGDLLFEILIPRRPVSIQVRDRQSLQVWKDFIYGRARNEWTGTPYQDPGLRVTLVYLCNDTPADIDNIIKPILDALIGIVYADDSLISDVDSHRRYISQSIDVKNLPPLLIQGIEMEQECVYLRVSIAENLEVYL